VGSVDRKVEEVIRQFLERISDRYDVVQTVVYGSRARGTHRPDSDVDVAVLLRGNRQDFISAKLDMADAAFDVLLDTGILISALPVWETEWNYPDNYPNPKLLENINKEGVRL